MLSASPTTYQDDMILLESAGRDAAKIALEYFHKAHLKKWSKSGGSPVSEADIAIDDFLKETLLSKRPDYGWLSEETKDNPARFEKKRIFIIDPIDGTRGFLRGQDDWTISLAIVEDERPIAAALVNPCRSEILVAYKDGGAFLNHEQLNRKTQSQDQTGVLNYVGPMDIYENVDFLRKEFTYLGRVSSLAYRLAMVAMARAELALAFRGSHEWDIAAADLILAEAGRKLVEIPDRAGLNERAILYNQKNLRKKPLVASHQDQYISQLSVLFEQ